MEEHETEPNVMEPGLAGYAEFLADVKNQIQTAQAILAVNRHLLELYWNIGREIAARQAAHGWGDSVLI